MAEKNTWQIVAKADWGNPKEYIFKIFPKIIVLCV